MIALLIVGFLLSLTATLWVRLTMRRHARRYSNEAPQRFHLGDVPRLGGVGILIGWLGTLLLLPLLQWLDLAGNIDLSGLHLLPWMLALLPAFLGGVYEDVTQRMHVWPRLMLTAASGLLACWLLDLSIPRLGILWVEDCWQTYPVLGVALALLAITGLPHAFNIIDGYNGLAAMVAIIVSLALAHVALQVGDRELAAAAVVLAAASAGFLVWNYPRGLIFAGDAGAYLWGFMIALISIKLVQRHPQVSPWFPMLLLIYPVWETLFSIYRKLARGVSPGVADALHFHQLVYRRLVREVVHDDEARQVLMRNNRTSPYLWGFMGLTVAPAVLFWRYSGVLAAFCVLFAVTYVAGYIMLVRFKVPRLFKR